MFKVLNFKFSFTLNSKPQSFYFQVGNYADAKVSRSCWEAPGEPGVSSLRDATITLKAINFFKI